MPEQTRIRRGVFETNSSSSHSIHVSSRRDVTYDSLFVPDDGIVKVYGGEFGWNWEVLQSAEEKLNYIAVAGKDSKDKLEMLREVVIEHTLANDVVFKLEDSYIDHNSAGNAGVVFYTKDDLKSALFNPNSVIITGNDNDEEQYSIEDYIDKEEYAYQIIVDGWEDEKFLIFNSPYEKLGFSELQDIFSDKIDNHPEISQINEKRDWNDSFYCEAFKDDDPDYSPIVINEVSI